MLHHNQAQRHCSIADWAFGNGGLNELEAAFERDCGTSVDCGNVVARVGQEDLLAVWPSVYPAETILNAFTYNGAPGAYNKNPGPCAGLWGKHHHLSLSTNNVAAVDDVGAPGQGGIGGPQWDKAFQDAKVLGFAFGQTVFATGLTGDDSPHDGNYAFAVWYEVKATDHISVMPAVFYLSLPLGRETTVGKSFDNLSAVIKNTFQF